MWYPSLCHSTSINLWIMFVTCSLIESIRRKRRRGRERMNENKFLFGNNRKKEDMVGVWWIDIFLNVMEKKYYFRVPIKAGKGNYNQNIFKHIWLCACVSLLCLVVVAFCVFVYECANENERKKNRTSWTFFFLFFSFLLSLFIFKVCRFFYFIFFTSFFKTSFLFFFFFFFFYLFSPLFLLFFFIIIWNTCIFSLKKK